VPLNILNVIQLGSKRILDVNDDDFPVSLALVKKSHDTKNFDLLNLADVTNLFPDFTDIERIIVSTSLGLGMGLRWVFPSLEKM
jgi:hypothetical protein